MATTKNIYVTGSGLRATVSTPVINVGYQNNGVTTSITQYGVRASEPQDIEINVQGQNIGGGAAPDTSILIGDNIVYSKLFSYPQIAITGHVASIGDNYTSFAIGKGFSETKTISENLNVYLSTGKYDTAQSTDTALKQLSKTFSESVTRTDRVSLAPNKLIIDATASSDSYKASLEKIFFEQKYVSERVTLVANFKRQFIDTIDATDDFYGVSNIDDDQIANVNKVVVDYGSLADTSSIYITTTKTDTTNTLDTSKLGLSKPFADSVSKSELFTLSASKLLVESLTLPDTDNKAVSKTSEDSFISIDENKFSVYKPFTETNNATDQSILSTGKVAAEAVAFQDTFSTLWSAARNILEDLASTDTLAAELRTEKFDQVSVTDIIQIVLVRLHAVIDTISHSDSNYTQVSYNRLVEELIDATDDFYGIANLDDDQIASVLKGAVDHFSVQDILSVSASKVLPTQYATVPDSISNGLNKPILEQLANLDSTSFISGKYIYNESCQINSDIVNIAASKYFTDSLINNDIFIKQVNTNRNDISITSDTIESFEVNKTKLDFSNTIDSISFNAKSTATDTAYLQNPIALNNTKQLLDTSTNSDTKYLQAYKTQIDLLNIKNADTVYSASAKVLGDVSVNTDTPKYTFSTTKSDSVGISETKIQLVTNYYRTYLDSIDATDDFYGEANVDDDQTARLGKNIVEYTPTLDIRSVHIGTVKQDTSTSTDTPYKQTKKITTDSFVASDVFSFNKVTDRDLADVRNVSDSVYINWQDYCEPNIFEPTYVGQERFLSYN